MLRGVSAEQPLDIYLASLELHQSGMPLNWEPSDSDEFDSEGEVRFNESLMGVREMRTHTHAHTRARARAHARTRTRTHAHTHTPTRCLPALTLQTVRGA